MQLFFQKRRIILNRRFILLILVSILLVLTACGTANDHNEENAATNNEAGNEVGNEKKDETENEEEAEEKSEDQSEDASENVAEPNEKKLLTETGIYNGQADPHTIEIETADGPQAFQLSIEARDDIEHLTEGKQVTYSYYEDGEQHVIETIEPTK